MGKLTKSTNLGIPHLNLGRTPGHTWRIYQHPHPCRTYSRSRWWLQSNNMVRVRVRVTWYIYQHPHPYSRSRWWLQTTQHYTTGLVKLLPIRCAGGKLYIAYTTGIMTRHTGNQMRRWKVIHSLYNMLLKPASTAFQLVKLINYII